MVVLLIGVMWPRRWTIISLLLVSLRACSLRIAMKQNRNGTIVCLVWTLCLAARRFSCADTRKLEWFWRKHLMRINLSYSDVLSNRVDRQFHVPWFQLFVCLCVCLFDYLTSIQFFSVVFFHPLQASQMRGRLLATSLSASYILPKLYSRITEALFLSCSLHSLPLLLLSQKGRINERGKKKEEWRSARKKRSWNKMNGKKCLKQRAKKETEDKRSEEEDKKGNERMLHLHTNSRIEPRRWTEGNKKAEKQEARKWKKDQWG